MVDPAFKLVEQINRVFAENIHQHIQSATVSHSNANLLAAIPPDSLNRLRHHRYETLPALKPESLGARIF
jgi:hypothetical protein